MAVKLVRLILIIFALSLSTSCSNSAHDREQSKIVNEETPAVKIGAERIEEAFALPAYPEATAVKLFINDLPNLTNKTKGMSNPDGYLLTATERLEFAATITRKVIIQTEAATSESAVEAACFVPHHFFRYFDADGKKIGEVKVCFCCERARSFPTIIETGPNEYISYDIAAIGRFVSSLDLPIDIHCPEGSYFQ